MSRATFVAGIAILSLAASALAPFAAARSQKVTSYSYGKHEFVFDVGFRDGVQICANGQVDPAFAASFLADAQRVSAGLHAKEITFITWWCGIHGVLMSADIRPAGPSHYHAGLELVQAIGTLPYVQYSEPNGGGEPDLGFLLQSPATGTPAAVSTKDATTGNTLRTTWGQVKAYYR